MDVTTGRAYWSDTAKKYLYHCGLQATHHGKLQKPKCRGRVLRMLAMYHGVLLPLQLGFVSVHFLPHAKGVLTLQYGLFKKQMVSRWKPRCLDVELEACVDSAHMAIFNSEELEHGELQCINRELAHFLGDEVFHRVNSVYSLNRPLLSGTPKSP